MKREITVYDRVTGGVLYTASVEDDAELHLGDAEDWIAGQVSGATHWINPETRRANQRQPFPARAAANALTKVPAGTVVIEGSEQYRVDGGAVIYEPSDGLEQALQLELRHPRYLPAVIGVPIGATPAVAIDGAIVRPIEQDYAKLRSYLAPGEQLGALAKAVTALMAGEPVPADALAVLAAIEAEKLKYPKPDAFAAPVT